MPRCCEWVEIESEEEKQVPCRQVLDAKVMGLGKSSFQAKKGLGPNSSRECAREEQTWLEACLRKIHWTLPRRQAARRAKIESKVHHYDAVADAAVVEAAGREKVTDPFADALRVPKEKAISFEDLGQNEQVAR